MASINDLLNNLKTLLDKFYLRKQSSNYNSGGVVVTDNNKNIITQQSISANSTMISGLSSVATSGSYADLINKPTKLSDFNNDLDYYSHGTQEIPIDNKLDLNDSKYKQEGWYFCKLNETAKTLSHTPWQEVPSDVTSERVGYAFAMEVLKHYGTTQIIYPYSNEGGYYNVYVRTNKSNSNNVNSWLGWYKIYTDSNLTKQDILNLGISSSDHNHNTEYLKLSGGSLTGNLSSNSNITTTAVVQGGTVKIANGTSSQLLLANGSVKNVSDFAVSGHNQATSTITNSSNYSNIGSSLTTQSSINDNLNLKLGEIFKNITNINGGVDFDLASMNDVSLIKYINGNAELTPTLTYNEGVGFTYTFASTTGGYYYHKIPLTSLPDNFKVSMKGKVGTTNNLKDIGFVLVNSDNEYEMFYIRPGSSSASSNVIRYTHATSSSNTHVISKSLSGTSANIYYKLTLIKKDNHIILKVESLDGEDISTINYTFEELEILEIGLLCGYTKYTNTVYDIEVTNIDMSEYLLKNYDNDIDSIDVNKILVTDESYDINTVNFLNSSYIKHGVAEGEEELLSTILNKLEIKEYTPELSGTTLKYTYRIVKFTRFMDWVLVEYSVLGTSSDIPSGEKYSTPDLKNRYSICEIPAECIPLTDKYQDIRTIHGGATDLRLIFSREVIGGVLRGRMRVNSTTTANKKLIFYGSFIYNISTDTYIQSDPEL